MRAYLAYSIFNTPDDEPYIEVSSTCLSDEVVFTINNSGYGDMTSNYDYTVLKNNVSFTSGTYNLDVNETLDLTYSIGFRAL